MHKALEELITSSSSFISKSPFKQKGPKDYAYWSLIVGISVENQKVHAYSSLIVGISVENQKEDDEVFVPFCLNGQNELFWSIQKKGAEIDI